MKYSAKLHTKFAGDFKFIGTVTANSLKDLKEKARQHARNWNERGRVLVSEENKGLEFGINA